MSDLKPGASVGVYHFAREKYVKLEDFERLLTTLGRALVTPIPVSEPPGDNDIVLLADMPTGDGKGWEFDTLPHTWSEVRSREFKFMGDAMYWHTATHYLLLKKGEL